MKKLPINITASVFDIINTVLYTFSWPLFIIADNSTGDISDILLGLFIVILYSLSLAGLGVNIASLVMS